MRENSLRAFVDALGHGAGGIESDVRLTADGVPVLVHGLARIGGRRLRETPRDELPPFVPALDDLWARCGSDFQLALDMADPDAIEPVIALARRYDAVARLWLTYWRLPEMARWHERWPDINLVYASMFAVPESLLRRTARRAAKAGVNALNIHHRLLGRWSVETAHAEGVQLFAWGLHGRAHEQRAKRLGADAVFVDDVVSGAPRRPPGV